MAPAPAQRATITHSTTPEGTTSAMSRMKNTNQTTATKVPRAVATKNRAVTRPFPKNAKKIPRSIRAAPQKSLYFLRKALRLPKLNLEQPYGDK